MTDESMQHTRRTALKALGVAGVAGLSSVAAGATGSNGRSGDRFVTKATARKAAEAKIAEVAGPPKFESWEGAKATPATTFHMKNADVGPDYVPSAYVFSVKKRGETLGYVTASARSDWAPILEFSPATPPTDLARGTASAARQQGASPTGRLIYHGGVKYGVELDDGTAMNVRNGKPELVDEASPSAMSFDGDRVAQDWEAATSDGVSTDSVSTQSIDWVYGVPAWTEHDDGGNSWTSYGTGDDEWIDWDGCTPVAGSMIIAYHEGHDESDTWYREYIIDRLHDTMQTDDSNGETFPSDIDNGFDNYTWGSNDYNGRNIYTWTTPDFEKQEVNNDRPFLLNMNGGGSAEDRSQNYGDHTVIVVGYKDDADYLEIHDTWDDDYHYLAWGSWSACSYTKVTTT